MLDAEQWEEHVTREVAYQAGIERAFDRAEAFERFGYPDHALKWLDRAALLGGGLPPAYLALRARLESQRA